MSIIDPKALEQIREDERTWETTEVAAFLKKAGVPDSEFHLDDGSGLELMEQERVNARFILGTRF